MVTGPGLPATPAAASPGPPCPPLPAPGGKPGDWDSYPPGINMPRPEIFSKNHSREMGRPPGVMGPRAAKISNGFWVEGLAGAGRLTEYPSGSVTRLLGRHRFSTQGLVQDWGRCRWRCPQRASSPRRRATAARADFFPPAASGVSPICKGCDIRRYGKISGRAYSGKRSSIHAQLF